MTYVSRSQQPAAPLPQGPRAEVPAPGGLVDIRDLVRVTHRQGPAPAALVVGSSGDAVSQVQAQLRRLGYFSYPTDTGYFGEGLAKAVRAFQVDEGLPPTGQVDVRTARAIGDVARHAAPTGPSSEIEVNASIQPRNRSTIPGFESSVEQCGEFAYRYFHTLGKGYPTQGQPYEFLQTGIGAFFTANGVVRKPMPQFERSFNGGAEPPRAGDILVAKGPRPGQFHTAIVTKVDAQGVHVLQANVPLNYQGGRDVQAVYPLKLEDGQYTMPPLPTSQKGYRDDFAVTGWIRPTGADALPQKP
jgi:peptidoglycan hydrolase-like protein with peptidoglycan-binding domain